MSFQSSKSSQSGNSNQAGAYSGRNTSEPWGPAIPYVQDFMKLAANAGGLGVSPDQQSAFGALKSNALQGDPWAQHKATATDALWGTTADDSRVGQAYNQFQDINNPIAQGQFLGADNPYTQQMVAQVGDDAFNRVRSAFNAAGRPMTGNAAASQAATRGVTQGTLPILFDQYNRDRGHQMQALGQIMPNAIGATSDQVLRAGQAAQMGDSALAARNYSAERMIDLDQSMKSIPYQDLAQVASLLFPVAGLGGTTTTQGQSSGSGNFSSQGKQSGMGFSLFSDERLKTDIEEVGVLHDGQKVYRYRYVGLDAYCIGLIAQEVRSTVPEAIGEREGYLTVDYKKATEEAVR